MAFLYLLLQALKLLLLMLCSKERLVCRLKQHCCRLFLDTAVAVAATAAAATTNNAVAATAVQQWLLLPHCQAWTEAGPWVRREGDGLRPGCKLCWKPRP
jgi:hypothetical protein